MAFATITNTGDGVTTDWSVTFDYLDTSHVIVRVNKVETDEVGSAYKLEWITPTVIRVTTVISSNPVPSGVEIEFVRRTPITTPAVIFGGGASLSSENLNKNSEYLTFALQEATDANDAFTKLYLGAKSVDPALDNDGNALIAGASYFNTVDDVLYFWTGSAWLVSENTTLVLAYRDAALAAQVAAEAALAAALVVEADATAEAVDAAASAVVALGHANDAADQAAAAAASAASIDFTPYLRKDDNLHALTDKDASRTALGLGSAAQADLIDDDTMASATAANVASAESIKTYVDAEVAAGGYTPPTTAGDVGTYAFAKRSTGSGDVAFGATLAGSSLTPSSAVWNLSSASGSFITGSALSGTWQAMGYFDQISTTSSSGGITLWLRIA